MSRIHLLLAVMLLLATPGCDRGSGADDERPPIEFEPGPRLDLGVLAPGEPGEATVRIWNRGDEALRILRSVTTCGCTHVDDLGGRTIEPGEYTEFDVHIDFKSGLGGKREAIRIIFEGWERRLVEYFFVAQIARAVHVHPPYLDATGEVLAGTVVVASRDERPFRILAAHGDVPVIVGFDPETDELRSSYVLRWDLGAYEESGVFPWFFVVETDHPEAPLVDVRIQHDSTRPPLPPGRPWVPKDQRVLVDRLTNGESVIIQTRIEYHASVAPAPDTVRVESTQPHLRAELVATELDGQVMTCHIRVTPDTAPPGLLYVPVRLIASGGETFVRVIGRVE